jgi:hypothetical protein
LCFYALTLLKARAAVNCFEENGMAENNNILTKSKKTFNDFFNTRGYVDCVIDHHRPRLFGLCAAVRCSLRCAPNPHRSRKW